MRKRKTREEKWDELERKFQKRLDEARKRALLADSFAEMKEIAGQVGRELERALLGAMAEQQEPVGRPDCPECGARMSRRGRNQRQLKTSHGGGRNRTRPMGLPGLWKRAFSPWIGN